MWSFRKKQSRLNMFIETFTKSKEINIQLDFYRKNGEVLMQLFKGYDVKSWDINIEELKQEDIVFQLLFHEDKINNTENLKRIENSSLLSYFKKIDHHNQNTYFYVQPLNKYKSLENEILNILDIVYDLGSEQIDFTLNAY